MSSPRPAQHSRAAVGPDARTVEGYDRLHERRAFQALPGYYEWLLSLVRARAGERLLDVGCGSGPLLGAAVRLGLKVAGNDISAVALDQARSAVPGADLRLAPAESLPFADGSFDVVVSAGSLEHFQDMAQALGEIRRVADAAARILIVVPNRDYLFCFVSRIRQSLFPGHSQPLERTANRSEWRMLFEGAGYRLVRAVKDNNLYLPGPALRLLVRVMARLIPEALSYQLAFLLEPEHAGIDADGADRRKAPESCPHRPSA
jgi:SAM-dependent methyltransferase